MIIEGWNLVSMWYKCYEVFSDDHPYQFGVNFISEIACIIRDWWTVHYGAIWSLVFVQEWTCRSYRFHSKLILEPSFRMLHDKEIGRISWRYIQLIAVSCQSLIMDGGTVSETVGLHFILTWLVTWEEIIGITWFVTIVSLFTWVYEVCTSPHHVRNVVYNELYIMNLKYLLLCRLKYKDTLCVKCFNYLDRCQVLKLKSFFFKSI
jgi:hypothetical protein